MKQTRGFTLIEMAIVLVIITILIGGLAMPLSAQIQARRIAETKKTLEEAREAIIGYAMTHNTLSIDQPTNRRLPCPDTDGDGVENLLGGTKCANTHGLLPWVDLGVASQDAWGNRLRYAVDRDLADPNKGFAIPDATLQFPALTVCQTHSCGVTVAANVAFVLVSHGPNGWGAQNINNAPGVLQAAPTGQDEADNLDASDETYVSRSATKPDTPNGEFDDLLVWVSYPQLVFKVCPTGSDCAPVPAP
jgi:prepilin-type N-terminal cleavage/methylation domain-containing protein